MSQADNIPSRRRQKFRRIQRACDQCSARSVKCRFGDGDTGQCQNCIDYSEDCTFHRPKGKRGPKPKAARSEKDQPSTDIQNSSDTSKQRQQLRAQLCLGKPEIAPDIFCWKPRMMPTQALVMDLTEIYFEVVYPVFPIFHRSTLLRKVSRGEYATNRPLLACVLALCALSSARVRDGALYTAKWDPQSLQTPSSEELFKAAREAIPHDAPLSQEFDYMRACVLLAITSIQYGNPRKMNYYLGLYHSFIGVGALHDENNWPCDIDHVETEERRRVFWSTYTLDIFSSIIWGGFAKSREACFNVCYPLDSDDHDSPDQITPTSDLPSEYPGWIKGWNFITDLYRILEHAVDRLGRLRNPVQRTPSIEAYNERSSSLQASVLTNIMTLYEQLPPVFKTTQPLTGNLHNDLFGFQAANIAASLQLVRMVLLTTEHSTVDQKCQIASEVINGFARVPVAYLRAISAPLLHHLAGIGSILGSVFESGLTDSTYRRVRLVLLDLANLLANLEVDLYCKAGTSDNLRAQVSRIDEFMKNQRSVDVTGDVRGLTPWNQSGHTFPPRNLQTQQLAMHEDSPHIQFPPELFENWSWAFDAN